MTLVRLRTQSNAVGISSLGCNRTLPNMMGETTTFTNNLDEQQTTFEIRNMAFQQPRGTQQFFYPFPYTQELWFTNGLPQFAYPYQALGEGQLLDFFPVDLISKVTFSEEPFMFDIPGAVGYIDQFGIYRSNPPSTLYNMTPGDRMVTVLLRSDLELLEDSYLLFKGYWELLYDWGIVDSNESFSRQVNISYGVNKTNAAAFSYSIGRYTEGSLYNMICQINEGLCESFGNNFFIECYNNLTETVNFSPSMCDKRVGFYQFIYGFDTTFGLPLLELATRQREDPNDIAFYQKSELTFDYKTNYFERVEVYVNEDVRQVNMSRASGMINPNVACYSCNLN